MNYCIKAVIKRETVNVAFDGEVYTLCPSCGAEHAIDIVSFSREVESFDLVEPAVYCSTCSAERQAERETKIINLDGRL